MTIAKKYAKHFDGNINFARSDIERKDIEKRSPGNGLGILPLGRKNMSISRSGYFECYIPNSFM